MKKRFLRENIWWNAWVEARVGRRNSIVDWGVATSGKSTIVRHFAEREYKSHLIIDFANTTEDVKSLFQNLGEIDSFFSHLKILTGKTLHERESVIIFDEVQMCPHARQAIKYLVADGRYDYIETGSLISIHKMWKILLSQVRKMWLICIRLTLKSFAGQMAILKPFRLCVRLFWRKKHWPTQWIEK